MAGTFLVGLIGADIQTSLSPRLHEDEAARLGLRYWYQLIGKLRHDPWVRQIHLGL